MSRALFGERSGYTRLLALEEAGAHVEYLFQRGELGIANVEEVAAQPEPGHPVPDPRRELRASPAALAGTGRSLPFLVPGPVVRPMHAKLAIYKAVGYDECLDVSGRGPGPGPRRALTPGGRSRKTSARSEQEGDDGS